MGTRDISALDSHPKFGDPAGSETGQAAAHSTVSSRELRENGETHIENAVDQAARRIHGLKTTTPLGRRMREKNMAFFLDRRTQQEQMDRYRGASG